jgi:hypothetical protein
LRVAPDRVSFAAVRNATGGFAHRIGEGGTGEVFRGELNGVPVAVKVLKLEPQATAAARAALESRFHAELNTLSSFSGHPRIVHLRGYAINSAAPVSVVAGSSNAAAAMGSPSGAVAEAAQRPFALVFELLEEGSLADHLCGTDGRAAVKAPLSAIERVDAALGAVQGLAYLHGLRDEAEVGAAGFAAAVPAGRASNPAPGGAASILHRDVKSANIGLTKQGGVYFAKLLDCGLAKAVRPPDDAAGRAGAATFSKGLVMGTPGYMAAEVQDGEYTVRSEVYSLGVVLLELLTGCCVGPRTVAQLRDTAEDGAGAAAVAARAEAGVWPPAAAHALAALALNCIALRPAKRVADMKAIAAGLRRVRAALPVAVEKIDCPICLCAFPASDGTRCRRALAVGAAANAAASGAAGGAARHYPVGVAARAAGGGAAAGGMAAGGAGAVAVAEGHFICHGCLQAHVVENLNARKLEANEGAVPCHEVGCASPWALEDLNDHLDKRTLVEYGRALRYHLFDAARAKREADAAFAARVRAANDARLAQAERVRQHRLVIAEQQLLLRCPRCAVAFADYDGCNALQCAKCGCGFCALCLRDCRDEGNDAHTHCAREHGGNIHDRPRFERTHRERRVRAVAAAVRALAGEGAALQRALVAELAKADLRDLGIGAEDVLREAGVGAGGAAAALDEAIDDEAFAWALQRQIDEEERPPDVGDW